MTCCPMFLPHGRRYSSQLEDIIEGVRRGKYPTLLKEGFRRVAVPQPGGGPPLAVRERLRQLAAACTAAKGMGRQLEGDCRLQALQQEMGALRERLARYESAGEDQTPPLPSFISVFFSNCSSWVSRRTHLLLCVCPECYES
jgi:hypothetical protein